MRRILLAALAVLSVGSVLALPALAATTSIKVGDDYFVKKGRATVTVKQGTTVTWAFKGKNAHTVVGSGAGRFINSGAPKKTGGYTLTVNKKGTFKIICTIHGSKQTMTLKVT